MEGKSSSGSNHVTRSLSSPCFPGGPSPVQYQHGAPALYQGQSGSPPSTGLPRVALATNQQAPSARPTVPLAQGVPQPQQVTTETPLKAIR